MYKDQFRILFLWAKYHLKTYTESTSFDYLNKDQQGDTLNAFSVGNALKCISGKGFITETSHYAIYL